MVTTGENNKKISNWWYLLPLSIGFIGGFIAWLINRNIDPKKARTFLLVGILMSLIIAMLRVVVIRETRKGIEKIIETKETVGGDAKIIAYMNLLTPELISYEEKNGSYAGIEKEPKIIQTKSDILVMGGKDLNIYTNEKKFCVEVQLISGNWYCMDSNWVRKQYTTNPDCNSGHLSCD